MRIAISGGRPQILCDVQQSRGGSWGTSGIIIFADRAGIYQVPESGGTPKSVTRLNQSLGEISHRFPSFLPDGRRFIFLSRITSKNQAIFAGSLDSNETKLVMSAGSQSGVCPTGLPFVFEGRGVNGSSHRSKIIATQRRAFSDAKTDGEVRLIRTGGNLRFR